MEIRRDGEGPGAGFAYPNKRAVVGVMGSGGAVEDDSLPARVGRWLAERGVDMLTGAGAGAMRIACRAFHETRPRAGLVIGIVPADEHTDNTVVYRPRPGYPNPWVELPIFTHLTAMGGPTGQDTRNHVNVLSSDVVILLPGGAGTLGEMRLSQRYRKPTVAWLGEAGRIADVTADRLPGGIHRAECLDDVAAFVDATLAAQGLDPS